MKSILASLVCAPFFCLAAEEVQTLRTAAELNRFREHRQGQRLPFDIEGDIHDGSEPYFLYIADKTGATRINRVKFATLPPLSRARLFGYIEFPDDFEALAVATSAVVTGHFDPLPPEKINLAKIDEIASRRLEFSMVETEGLVIDVLDDQVDPRYSICILKDATTCLPAPFFRQRHPHIRKLIGARVKIIGFFVRTLSGKRRFAGPSICINSVEVLTPPPDDPFLAPSLDMPWYSLTPRELSALDRHKVSGKVLAAWNEQFLIQKANGQRINVQVAGGVALPRPGETIEAVGYPQTDTYRINLSNARWRTVPNDGQLGEQPTHDTTAEKILLDENGQKRIDSDIHGEIVRLRGIVRSLPADLATEKRLILDSGQFKVPIDCSSCPSATAGLSLGMEIEVVGCCILETPDWSPHKPLPQTVGITLVTRTPADFRILKRPSWWTPARFVMALLALLGILVVIFLWNLSLQVLVKRRARQIFKADLARVTSELRVEDRTRLAVELHDALSQSLTGVSMEIEAATRYGTEEPENLMRHLQVADKVLKSCRTELRNSLWDLRNQALEEHDLNEAIRRTLLPHIKNVQLNVRFQVPRSRLTDNTTHEILHIIRELAVNGISHGGANEIRVAGSIENETLLFSVRDNGAGFDPDTAPGVLQGHFGLKGIQDRLRRLSGKLELNSVFGEGTRAVVSLRLPQSQKKDSPS